MLTEHFSFYELVNTSVKDGIKNNLRSLSVSDINNLFHLSNVLERIRSYFRSPIKVNSGFRCSAVNFSVGGVPTSNHMKGLAADICPADHKQSLNRLYMVLENNKKELGINEIILHNTYIHFSVFPF